MADVKFASYDEDDFGHKPVEPELLRRLEQERTDARLSSPTPSVLQALSSQSTSLYDLGTLSGMSWARMFNEEGRNPYQSMAYDHYTRMLPLIDCKRPHLYRAYADGFVAGWSAVATGVIS